MAQPEGAPGRLLGVNIDHVATLRQARGVDYPSVAEAVLAVERGGADFITAHLREDRRHIQDGDVPLIMDACKGWLNLEISADPEMVRIACERRPKSACLVPERREELTTEGGLDVAGSSGALQPVAESLKDAGVEVSFFIDPDPRQIEASKETGAQAVELHTGSYANLPAGAERNAEADRIVAAAEAARGLGLTVNLGHGLTVDNVIPLLEVPHVREYNIGHSIVARAVFVGLEAATAEMREALRL